MTTTPPGPFVHDLRGDVGELLRRSREERGWSQARLAAAVGVGTTSVRAWEHGRRAPGLEAVERALAALGLRAVLTAEPLHRVLDEGLDRLAGLTAAERLERVGCPLDGVLPFFLAHGLDPVVDGPTAALLHGLPVADRRVHVTVDAAAATGWVRPVEAEAEESSCAGRGRRSPADPDLRWEALFWALACGRSRPAVRSIAPRPEETAPVEPGVDRDRLREVAAWRPHVLLRGEAEVVVRVVDGDVAAVRLAVGVQHVLDVRFAPRLARLPPALEAAEAWDVVDLPVRVRALADLAADPAVGVGARRALERALPRRSPGPAR